MNPPEAVPQSDEPRTSLASEAARQPGANDRMDSLTKSAISDVGSWARFLGVSLFGISLDLWSKAWAFEAMGQNGRRILIPNLLEFQTMLNPGALFGIGRGQTTLFLVASLFALVLVGWMFAQTSPRRRLLQIALGGILAGALGNMYDRITVRLYPDQQRGMPIYLVENGVDQRGRYILQPYPISRGGARRFVAELPPAVGYVRDFIKIPTKLYRDQDLWPWVFNVADMLLVGGVSILAIYLWCDRSPVRRRGPPSAGETEETRTPTAD